MMGPGDEAAGRGRYSSVRASHADRDRVVDMLKAAFVQGRLAKDEFDLRLSRVLTSRTYADLDALTADIPAVLLRPQLPEPDPGSSEPAGPGIDGKEDRQGVGIRDCGAAERGGGRSPAEGGNRPGLYRDRHGHVRLRGGRPGQRAPDFALLDREALRQHVGRARRRGIRGHRMMATSARTADPRA